MRTVELARVALAAEGLYLRRVARRQALRGAFAVAAAIFAVLMLAVLHIVLYQLARLWLSPLLSAVVVFVLDIVVTGILATLALRGAPDPVETEARQIRVQAVAELRASLTAMGMAAEMAGLLMRSKVRSGARRGVATAVAEVASRLVGR